MKLYMQMIQNSAAFLLVAVALLLVSCEKSEDINDSYPASGDGQCMLLPPSIMVEPFGGGSVFTRAASAIKEERHQFNVGEELGNIITLGNGEMDTEEIAQTRASINAGVFYRIVIYTATEYIAGTLKITEQRLCKTGSSNYFGDADDSTEPIYLYPGTYKIFCYSFNNAIPIPKLSDGTSTIALTDGNDFMSTVVDKTIGNTDLGNKVNLGGITLYHRCCKLTGNLTAEGFDDSNITGTPTLSISGTFSKTGTWSISKSTFSQSTTFGSKTIKVSGSGKSRSGSVIMLPIPKGIVLKTTYSFMPTSASKTVAKKDATLSSAQTFESGHSYAFTIKAVGAYVLTDTNPVQIGSYNWAYANLNNDKTMESNPWVSGQQGGGSKDNDYWRWNMLSVDMESGYPASKPATWSSSTDPCKAKLGSSWIVPPQKYFEDLIGYKLVSKKVLINGVIAATNGNGWISTGSVAGCVFFDPSLSTCMFLPAAGRRYGGSYYNVGTVGTYWSATLSTSNTNDAYYFYFNSGDCNFGYLDRFNGYSLRCAQPK